jgi:hypothetical protein
MVARTGRGGRQPAILVAGWIALASGAAAAASPPELGWRLLPGDGDGAEDSQTASSGPVGATRANSLPGVSSDGAASASYGTLSARTQTAVNAAQQSGESFCFPLPPAPSCSEAETWWADRLVFAAPGVVPTGTPGSFTARITISPSGQLAASKPSDVAWTFVTVEADYQAAVSVDGILLETVAASCIAIPGMSCIPVPLQVYFGDPPQQKDPPGPFGTFDLGPYDFTWGQPFVFEVRLLAHTSMNSEDQTSGQASASADLEDTLVWSGVLSLFDAPGGGGSAVPLGAALVSPASGVGWLGNVAVPEPDGRLLAAAALGTLAALRRGRGGPGAPT